MSKPTRFIQDCWKLKRGSAEKYDCGAEKVSSSHCLKTGRGHGFSRTEGAIGDAEAGVS